MQIYIQLQQILTNVMEEIGNNTIIIWNYNTHSHQMRDYLDRKSTKEMLNLKYILAQVDITEIYRTSQPKEAKYTFLSNIYRPFSRIGHILIPKMS